MGESEAEVEARAAVMLRLPKLSEKLGLETSTERRLLC